MADSTTLLNLIAMGLARPIKAEYSLDSNCLALAARTTQAWHLYVAFRYDTSTEGGLSGFCSIVLPEAEEAAVVEVIRSALELGGYQFGQQLDAVDLTVLLGDGVTRFVLSNESQDLLHLGRIISPVRSYDIKIRGNLIELRGASEN